MIEMSLRGQAGQAAGVYMLSSVACIPLGIWVLRSLTLVFLFTNSHLTNTLSPSLPHQKNIYFD